MDPYEDIITQIELHSVEGISRCFSAGVDPNSLFNNEPLIYELISEYTRSRKFKECVRAFVVHGLKFENKPLLAVLLDDAQMLIPYLDSNPELVRENYNLPCAYTPLEKVSLLHISAEFNHLKVAQSLIGYGADVNARAGKDTHGFGGQTPIFHTVNQNSNQSAQMMEFLLKNDANLSITLEGLIWGKGYDWETFVPSVNPISYAMMGLLPQMHRDEKTISDVVSMLLNKEYGIEYQPANIPNKYLSN